jgi:hypothetical protein
VAASDPLNVLQLAKGSGLTQIPGTPLMVMFLNESFAETPEQALWLMVVSGELIVDLPFGDFRLLGVGDCVRLSADTAVQYKPLEDTVVLRYSD